MKNLYLIKYLFTLIVKKNLNKKQNCNKNQIVVNGCARSDYAFKLEK